MFNLFSSFDLWFFNLPYLNMIFFVIMFLSYWNKNMKVMMTNYIFNYLFKSFMALNYKKFNKMLCFYILIFMMFIFFMNFFGNMPYSIPLTSQMSLVLIFSMMNWLMINLFLMKNLLKSFLCHSIPENTPIVIILFLFIIEIISNFIRPLTLMLRLVGNIVSGHIFLILIFMMISNISLTFFFLFIMYMMIELIISFLQSYIMSTLIIMYYSEL